MRRIFRSSYSQQFGLIKNGYRRLLNSSYRLKPSPVQMANGQAIFWRRIDTFERFILATSVRTRIGRRKLEGYYHSFLNPLLKDRIWLRTQKSVSQENIYIYGSGTCEGDYGEFLAKKSLWLTIICSIANLASTYWNQGWLNQAEELTVQRRWDLSIQKCWLALHLQTGIKTAEGGRGAEIINLGGEENGAWAWASRHADQHV